MRVVGIGGGHGLAATLRAARLYADTIDAVVTVADDGGSSGRLTRELGIPPPGDIRNCLVALASDDLLARLFQHRFESGALTGHTAGNILIAALTEMHGDFARAVGEAGRLLGAQGQVHPATTDLVELNARVEGGIVSGQVAVAQTKAPIQAVYITPPDPKPNGGAIDAISSADQIVMGPGSLFTSLIATMLVPEIKAAVRGADCLRVFVCNARMQKGETDGLAAVNHVEALMAHVGADAVDVVVVQSPVIAVDGVAVDTPALEALGIRVVGADIATDSGVHDPERLAQVLSSL